MSREEPKPSQKMHDHCLLMRAFGDRTHNIAVVTLEFYSASGPHTEQLKPAKDCTTTLITKLPLYIGFN